MKIAILDAGTLGDDICLDSIKKHGECSIYYTTEESEITERIKNADVVIVNKVKLNCDILKNAPSLKLICVAATGYDNIDVEYCRKNSIALCNVVGYSTDSVAQLTAAMVLSLSVNLYSYTDYVASGKYSESGKANKVEPVYHELCGKTWGIVGFGNIGRKVAALARALGCRVVVNKREKIDDFECVSLEKLCEISDVITIHTPLTEKTRNMINKDTISLMKKDVILVNAARGAVTDEAAICDAIENGQIGAFGTDVYSVEPFGKEHPFYKIMNRDNVCFTPHMAWGSYEARSRCMEEIAKNIEAFKSGEIRNRIDLI